MYKNILVPLAFDHDSAPDKALEVAQALSSPGAQVTLLHVVEETPPYAIYRLSDEDMASLRSAIRAELEELAAKVPGAYAEVTDGHSGRTIHEWARDRETDCIVISSHRPGLQEYLLGSTAQYVVRHARCSVHVLR